MTFQQDIATKHLNVFPAVHIVYEDDSIAYLSTRKVSFDGNYYQPILLNIPSISESIDVETKKYRISSVTLNVSDYEDDGRRFSDSLIDTQGNSITNAQVYIYFVSQSAQGETDFQLVGHFIIRKFTQSESQVNLICEDRSQAELHKDLPGNDLPTNDTVLERYKGKPYPLVYGRVDRSPLVLQNITYEGEELSSISAFADYQQAVVFNEDTKEVGTATIKLSPLFVHEQDEYWNIKQDAQDFLNGQGADNFTFAETENNSEIIFNVNGVVSDGTGAILENDFSQNKIRILFKRLPVSQQDIIGESADNTGSLTWDNPEQILNESLTDGAFLHGTIDHWDTSTPPSDFGTNFAYIELNLKSVPSFDFTSGKTWIFTKVDVDVDGVTNADSFWAIWVASGNSADIDHVTAGNADSIYTGFFIRQEDYNSIETDGEDAGHEISGWSNPGQYNSLKVGAPVHINNSNTTGIISNKYYYLIVVHQGFVSGITDKKYFADVTGRISGSPTAPEIITNILGEELDFAMTAEDIEYFGTGDWALSFTVDKKINSKKLIEEILQSTPYYGYFKDNRFKLFPTLRLPLYPYPVRTIKASDVISYKYDRTPIEKVATRVNVKYHYDYGLKDFTKETGWLVAENIVNVSGNVYTNRYYGIESGKHQDLEFESKYIRTEDSAFRLASYLLRQFCNQHNIFTVKLPLSYLDYSLSDIVRFDHLIQGRKAFGEDYTFGATIRNGQVVFYSFQVIGIKKTLEYVELKLFQLHDMLYPSDGEDQTVIPGCTDSNATNYNPDATINDGSCVFPPATGWCALPSGITETDDNGDEWTAQSCSLAGGHFSEEYNDLTGYYGCMDETALNYDETAQWDDGSCAFTPFLGTFIFTSAVWQYEFLQITQLPGAAVTIQWSHPENYLEGLTQPQYHLSIYNSPEFISENLVYINHNINTNSATFPVEVLGLDGTVGVANEFYASVTCTNPYTAPTSMTCDGQYGAYFLFSVTILFEEEELPDYPPFELTDPLNLVDAELIPYEILNQEYPPPDVFPFEQFAFTLTMEANSPEVNLDEDRSFIVLDMKFGGSNVPSEGYEFNSPNNYWGFSVAVKVKFLEAIEQENGNFHIKFISDKVFCLLRRVEVYGGTPFYSASTSVWSINGYDELLFGDQPVSSHPQIFLPDDPIYTNINYYDDEQLPDVAQGGNKYVYTNRIAIVSYKFVFNNNQGYDIYSSTLMDGGGNYNSGWGNTQQNSILYGWDSGNIPANIITHDLNADTLINTPDLAIMSSISTQIYSLYPTHVLLDPISIVDPLLESVSQADVNLQNVWALLDLNGQVPAGQFCKQDIADVIQAIADNIG